MPRPNLYQSLHTAVIHSGQPFEVQIRTQEMHRIAEQGVAAHWKYKDGRGNGVLADDQRIIWMRHLIEWVQEMQEPSEFLSTLRVDLYPEEVYTFTPKGRVVVLPRGATPIDFAYAVHTEVGHQCAGAKVNGEMVPLRHALANGDVVEIVAEGTRALARLALHRAYLAGPQQDPAVDSSARTRRGYRSGPAPARKGSAQAA
jgi:guanosine-3',5'-bis(diphosphate) 3'-pyrophosphohydrolase